MITGEFVDELRGWRKRRRVSQLELALRAGTTQRHLSFIESGRSQPGRELVIRLAESLEVPLRERNKLLLAAGYAPAYRDTPLDDARLDPVRAALEHVLAGHEPYPAVIIDRNGDLVSANGSFDLVTEGVAAWLLEPPVSLPRLLLHPDGLAPSIANLDVWGRHVLDGMRRRIDRTPSAAMTALIDELAPLVPTSSAQSEHAGFAVPLRLRTDDGELRLLSTVAHFGTTLDVAVAELSLEAFLPADRPTADLLASRRA